MRGDASGHAATQRAESLLLMRTAEAEDQEDEEDEEDEEDAEVVAPEDGAAAEERKPLQQKQRGEMQETKI